jgi:hypothetical protein
MKPGDKIVFMYILPLETYMHTKLHCIGLSSTRSLRTDNCKGGAFEGHSCCVAWNHNAAHSARIHVNYGTNYPIDDKARKAQIQNALSAAMKGYKTPCADVTGSLVRISSSGTAPQSCMLRTHRPVSAPQLRATRAEEKLPITWRTKPSD